VDVGDKVSRQHQLEQVSRQIVMKEQCSVVEEERKIMKKITHEQNFSSLTELLEFFLVNIEAQSSSSEQIEDQEG